MSGPVSCWAVSATSSAAFRAQVTVDPALMPPLLCAPPKGLSLLPGRTSAFFCEVSSEGAEATASWSFRASKGAETEAPTKGSRKGRVSIPSNGALVLRA